jgi:hypothetical protein
MFLKKWEKRGNGQDSSCMFLQKWEKEEMNKTVVACF